MLSLVRMPLSSGRIMRGKRRLSANTVCRSKMPSPLLLSCMLMRWSARAAGRRPHRAVTALFGDVETPVAVKGHRRGADDVRFGKNKLQAIPGGRMKRLASSSATRRRPGPWGHSRPRHLRRRPDQDRRLDCRQHRGLPARHPAEQARPGVEQGFVPLRSASGPMDSARPRAARRR